MPKADQDKWDAKYRARGGTVAPPSAFVSASIASLPASGRCLDVAGGSGRHAVLLARHGLDVTVADVSPEGLRVALERARAEGVSLQTLEWDVEDDGLPRGPWDVIVCVHFLHRPLFDLWFDALAPGGLLVIEHPTRANLERHPKPSERYLLADGEMETLLDARLEVLAFEEGWGAEDRHEARVIARRPA